jgi:hypothetical protein
MTLPDYFRAFCEANFRQFVDETVEEFIRVASTGSAPEGSYTLITVHNLIQSREAGKDPKKLGWFGK